MKNYICPKKIINQIKPKNLPMVKTFSKQRKFRRIRRRLRYSHLSAKKRLQRRKAKFVQKTEKNKNVKSELNQTNNPAIITSNDILSKF